VRIVKHRNPPFARGRAVVAGSGLDQMRRPQTLNLEEWGVLYDAYRRAG